MKKPTVRYAAFLRGINVGGNKNVKMQDLLGVLNASGFANTKTVLASGNVLFEAPQSDTATLEAKIEETLLRALGREVGVVVRSVDEIRALFEAKPFAAVTMTPDTRLYVTFLKGSSERAAKLRKSPNGAVTVAKASPREVCCALVLSPGFQTTELMSYLEKELGRDVTTRNWNTIEKILKS